MTFKNKRWFHHLTQKIFPATPSRKTLTLIPPTLMSEEYTEEELALMDIPVVCDLLDENWTPTSNQKTQREQEV
ncbi:hypothetical protein [Vibrio parahaemolyticus]|uniref:hypothetical protein n=1 Tax=Vibrio parahaemolyticus TaxID=670 RepID=UPI001C920592|nr:hypothetical protein [Vibrio parahaemolyticus]MBY3751117.1 hypothetical protein [Vibrio parahaemolyticus]MBY3762218.1 hypothetical protein [Vibrio parahaemolyticus]MBY3763191.1 hypothetical protein [Vibrio parahaemolyticus]MBY3772786.1 hypothetical protein [Vibrio parahaemolyticus]MBY3780578.1 hypothetical protein [Vibrio parahaemolyticus]